MNTNEPWEHHPDNYQQDLNPDGGAGFNVGMVGAHPEKSEDVRTAYDVSNHTD